MTNPRIVRTVSTFEKHHAGGLRVGSADGKGIVSSLGTSTVGGSVGANDGETVGATVGVGVGQPPSSSLSAPRASTPPLSSQRDGGVPLPSPSQFQLGGSGDWL